MECCDASRLRRRRHDVQYRRRHACLFAAVILPGGALQLAPAIRRRAPVLHRWTGRVYLIAAATMGLGGLSMVWIRGAVGDFSQHVAITANALIIFVCAAAAVRHARLRQTSDHRRWALRLFVAVSGVWFFRIGLMLWIVVCVGPVGFDKDTFAGPALTAFSVIAYVASVFVLQL
jgi:uncharacterized membrane protein